MVSDAQATPTSGGEEAFITIVAPTTADIMQQFRERRLAEAGYAIAGRIGLHVFALGGAAGGETPFGGKPMMAATFIRATHRP